MLVGCGVSSGVSVAKFEGGAFVMSSAVVSAVLVLFLYKCSAI